MKVKVNKIKNFFLIFNIQSINRQEIHENYQHTSVNVFKSLSASVSDFKLGIQDKLPANLFPITSFLICRSDTSETDISIRFE